MFNLFCCWSLLLWNSLQRTFSLLTQDWISWYWPNKSVTSVTILKILYLWEEFQDFWIWRQWLLSLCLGVHTWRRGGEISLFTALIRYLSRRCFWPSNGYQRLKWGFALFIILFFFFFLKMPCSGEGSEMTKLPTWSLLPQRLVCGIHRGAHHCSPPAVCSFIKGTLDLANLTAVLKHLSGKVCFLCFMSVQHAISRAGDSMKNHYIPEKQPLGKQSMDEMDMMVNLLLGLGLAMLLLCS